MILIITFQNDLLDQLVPFLHRCGLNVRVAPHRQDVFPMVKEIQPSVVVLDMYVTNPSAREILRDLRAHGFTGKVVLLAGSSISSSMPDVLRRGVDQIVGSPQGIGGFVSLGQIESAIRRALHPVIARHAYELWEAEGRIHGRDLDHWLKAEKQILKSNETTRRDGPESIENESNQTGG